MIKIYRYISTVKAKDPQGDKPTHYLKATENQKDPEGEFVASLWSKSIEKDGERKAWLSGAMKTSYTSHNDPSKNRDGFVIVKERDLNELLKMLKEEKAEEVPEDDGTGIPF